MIKYFIAVVIGLTGLISTTTAQQQEESRIRTVRTGASEGKLWLSWGRGTRVGFVRGYLTGIHVGYRDGCFESSKDQPSSATPTATDSPFGHCLSKSLRFSNTPEYYEIQITRFFATYKSDLGLPLDELLRLLSEGKTLDQIHEWSASSRGE